MHGEEFSPPTPIAWYPNKLAWQLDASRNQLRKVITHGLLGWLSDIMM